MNHKYKPGDVAMVKIGSKWYVGLRDRIGWIVATTDGPGDHIETCEGVDYEVRPLVVIDPDTILPGWNGSLLSSLLEACAEIVAASTAPREIHETTLLRNLADAFDAVLDPKPPKPDEPQGLGAVVEDERGVLWIRTCQPCENCLNKPWQQGPVRRNWHIVDAAIVLSEGVVQP